MADEVVNVPTVDVRDRAGQLVVLMSALSSAINEMKFGDMPVVLRLFEQIKEAATIPATAQLLISYPVDKRVIDP